MTIGKCIHCKGCLACSYQDPTICFECFSPQVLDKATDKCVDIACTSENCVKCDFDGQCV